MKDYWIVGSGGFGTSANWSDGVPGPNDIACLTASGTYTVTAGANHTVLGLITAPGATLDINNGATFSAAEGTLTGANNGTISVADGSTLILGGAVVDNPGTIAVSAGSDPTILLFNYFGNTTLDGGGTIALSDNPDNVIDAYTILFNVNDTISGAGVISGFLFNEKHGVVDATGTNNQLSLSYITLNSGLLEATGSAGLALNGYVLNSGGTVFANAGSQIDITEAEIFDGALTTSGTGVINVQSFGLLLGSAGNVVSNAGEIVVSGAAGSATLAAGYTLVNTGAIVVAGGSNVAGLIDVGTLDNSGTISLGSNGSFDVSSSVTLEGGGQVTLGDPTDSLGVAPSESAGTLNNVNNVIVGGGTIGGSGFTLNNEKQGTVNALANALIISSATVSNAGLLEATDIGYLSLQNTSVLNTTSGVIEAGVNSHVDLFACTISGGTLKSVGLAFIEAGYTTFEGNATNPLKNDATVVVSGGEQFTLEGVIDNLGQIDIQSSSVETVVYLEAAGSSDTVTLTGSGTIALPGSGTTLLINPTDDVDSSGTVIGLVNVNDTISGAADIGGLSNLKLTNEAGGTIVATGVDPVVIDTGSNTVTNAGTLAATSASDLVVFSNLDNSGLLVANSGAVIVGSVVTGTGKAIISGGGEVEFGSSSTNNVTFVSGSTGELVLDDAIAYSGVISGFATSQSIDLVDIPATATVVSYAGGILTISGGPGDVVHLHIAGSHTLGEFALVPDGGTGAILTDPEIQSATAATGASNLALLGSYMAALVASAEGQAIATTTPAETTQNEAMLTHPHTG